MNASVTHGADSTRLREIGDQLIAEGRRHRELEQQGTTPEAPAETEESPWLRL